MKLSIAAASVFSVMTGKVVTHYTHLTYKSLYIVLKWVPVFENVMLTCSHK